MEVRALTLPAMRLREGWNPTTPYRLSSLSPIGHACRNHKYLRTAQVAGPPSGNKRLSFSVIGLAGDDGSTDGGTGKNVDFPASSPYVLACGETKLDANGGNIVSEVVWNELANKEGATGGGVSNVFALPSWWQANVHVPASSKSTGGRGVPDVAGDADPTTGYTIRADGETTVIGGTSAVAPLWAWQVAVANQQLGTHVGFIQPAIYAAKAASAFNDITVGNNGAFSVGPGWDASSGLGSPIANKLIPLLTPASTSAKGSSSKSGKAGKRPAKKATRKAGK